MINILLRSLTWALLITIALLLPTGSTLAHSHHIVVRGDFDYPPYEYLDNGVPTGFNIDVLRAVAEAMNLKIKIDLGPWDEVRRQLENSEIDALAGMFESPKRDKLVDFSSPHLIVSKSLFVHKDSPVRTLDDLRHLRNPGIVVQRGDIMHDFALTRFPNATIIPVESPGDALSLLASSKHDAALVGRYQGLYIADKVELEGILAVGPPLEPRRYAFAVPEGRAKLLAQLNEGIALIKQTGRYDEIHSKWFGIYNENALGKDTLYIGIALSVLLGLMLAASLVWSWALKRKVREKTLELENELNVRLRAEQELSTSRKRFEDMVQNSPLGSAILDHDGNFLLVNNAFEEMFGYNMEDVADVQRWLERAYPSKRYRENVSGVWSQDASQLFTGNVHSTIRIFKVTCKDGTVKDVEFRASCIGDDLMVIFADVTERLRTEEALVQTEKMMSLGGMASGMAHEINNPLGGILQGVQNVIRRFSPGLPANIRAAKETGLDLKSMEAYLRTRKIDTMLQGIKESGERAAEVVSDMLTFSRTSESRRANCVLGALADKAIELASAEYNLTRRYDFRNITIERDYEKSMPQTPCTETEIVQVFLNILRNAAHALCDNAAQTEPPRITITIRQNGSDAEITFTDNGPGMPPNIAKRVFEPFFTTRDPGEGTGLGLSVAFFIITRNHGGTIAVQSKPEQGTTFTVRLPQRDDNGHASA